MGEAISYTTRLGAVLGDTHAFAIVVEECLEFGDVGVTDHAHDLEFAVLA